MSRDLHTPNVEAAAAHAAHHAHPDDRPGWDIHPADVDFPCDPPTDTPEYAAWMAALAAAIEETSWNG